MDTNFGELNYTLKAFVADGIAENKASNKKLLKRFVSLLKENKILRNEFLVYNNIERRVGGSVEGVSQYINENIKIMESYTKAQIDEANGLLAEMVDTIKVKRTDNPLSKLHESIHALMVSKASVSNVDARMDAKEVISEHIKNNTPIKKLADKILPNSIVAPIYVGSFNKKYEKLDEDTKKVIRKVINSPVEEREAIYVGLVRECVELVDTNLKESETEIKEKLLSTKDKLLNLKYNGETFIKEVGQLFDLKSTLK